MPKRFQSSLWFILIAAAFTAGAGAGMHVLFQETGEKSVARPDCGARAGQEKRRDDWGKIFDGLSTSTAHLRLVP